MAEVTTRKAHREDISFIVDLSASVQAALTASGSLQQIIIQQSKAEWAVTNEYCYILEKREDKERMGSVFIAPLTKDSGAPITDYDLIQLPPPYWYLQTLMIKPEYKGRGLGLQFLEDVLGGFSEEGTVLLDCWAGNTKLRAFYHHAGFEQLGIFPEEDYKVVVFFKRVKASK